MRTRKDDAVGVDIALLSVLSAGGDLRREPRGVLYGTSPRVALLERVEHLRRQAKVRDLQTH
jgi:hypothetical protein